MFSGFRSSPSLFIRELARAASLCFIQAKRPVVDVKLEKGETSPGLPHKSQILEGDFWNPQELNGNFVDPLFGDFVEVK